MFEMKRRADTQGETRLADQSPIEISKEHAKRVSDIEVRELRKALKELFPESEPVTVQLFQPTEGGRLVDVGPRPGGGDAVVYQMYSAGKTGDLFQDPKAPHRFVPLDREIGRIDEGTFSAEQLDLEKLRYPSVGTWADFGPPERARIYQLPLAPIPPTLCPRKRASDDAHRYRFPNVGAVYTMTDGSTPLSDNDQSRIDRLILYGLAAGNLAHRVRFKTVCEDDDSLIHPSERRLVVLDRLLNMKLDWSTDGHAGVKGNWQRNGFGGLCRLVGTMLLHHHWFFPYDHLAYRVLRFLGGAAYVDHIYYDHLCLPPCTTDNGERKITNLSQDLELLCQDIVAITGVRLNSDDPL